MIGSAFRPRVEEIEERVNPSVTPADVYAAVQQIEFNAAILEYVTQPEIFYNPFTQPYVGGFLNHVFQHNSAATAVLDEFMSEFQVNMFTDPSMVETYAPHFQSFQQSQMTGHMHMSSAQSFAAMLGMSLTLPGVSVPGTGTPGGNGNGSDNDNGNGGQNPGTPPADAGMSNTMPNHASPDFVNIGNGVKTKDVVLGSGAAVKDGDKIVALYTLWSSNGTELSRQRDLATAQQFPFTIPSGVIEGFGDGVIGMKAGGIRQMFIPSNLAYGSGDLVFEVKIISITPGTPSNDPPMPDYESDDFEDIGGGLLVKDVEVGDGDTVVATDAIVALYKVWSTDGVLVQSQTSPTVAAANPINLEFGSTAGFTGAVVGMREGGVRQFFVPLNISDGFGGLVYEVELLAIVTDTPPDDDVPDGMTETAPDTTGNDFTELDDGVRVKTITAGTGTGVAAGDALVALYTAWDENGDVIESQYSEAFAAANPILFPDSVSPGFEQAVLGLKPGGIRQFYLPADQSDGRGIVTYEVKLLSIL